MSFYILSAPTTPDAGLVAFRDLCWHYRRQGIYQPHSLDLEDLNDDGLLVVASLLPDHQAGFDLAETIDHAGHPYLGYGCYDAAQGLHILTDPRIETIGLWHILLDAIEDQARQRGIDRLWARANWLGEGLFIAHGFAVTEDAGDNLVHLEKILSGSEKE